MDRNADDAHPEHAATVATREGGVDRNFELFPRDAGGAAVATREGGVDRNVLAWIFSASSLCRHPRGWRG